MPQPPHFFSIIEMKKQQMEIFYEDNDDMEIYDAFKTPKIWDIDIEKFLLEIKDSLSNMSSKSSNTAQKEKYWLAMSKEPEINE